MKYKLECTVAALRHSMQEQINFEGKKQAEQMFLNTNLELWNLAGTNRALDRNITIKLKDVAESNRVLAESTNAPERAVKAQMNEVNELKRTYAQAFGDTVPQQPAAEQTDILYHQIKEDVDWHIPESDEDYEKGGEEDDKFA